MNQQEDEPALVSAFYVGDGLYGINTMEVQEVVTLKKLTTVHHAPSYISGIINLRGQIVTVLDLAARLEIEREENSSDRYIMIVAWNSENVGLIVDSVADTIQADSDQLLPLPANINGVQQKFLKGICQAGSHPIAILDINAVLNGDEDEATSSGSR